MKMRFLGLLSARSPDGMATIHGPVFAGASPSVPLPVDIARSGCVLALMALKGNVYSKVPMCDNDNDQFGDISRIVFDFINIITTTMFSSWFLVINTMTTIRHIVHFPV